MKKILLMTAIVFAGVSANAQYYGGYYKKQPVYQSIEQYPQKSNYRPSGNAPTWKSQSSGTFSSSSFYRNGMKKTNKDWYIAPRAGLGATLGWDDDLDNAVSPVFGLAVGHYFGNVRADVEFDYHMEGDVLSEGDLKIEYSQWDLGANIYYDFDLSKSFKPFVGVGIGASNAKLKASAFFGEVEEDETAFMASGAIGAAYHFNDTFALEMMGRYRYLFRDSGIYNLEALAGFRVSF